MAMGSWERLHLLLMEKLWLQYTVPNAGVVKATLKNLQGKIVLSHLFDANAGINTLETLIKLSWSDGPANSAEGIMFTSKVVCH
jgi:hypothetical protein